jgi:hypothetical protein
MTLGTFWQGRSPYVPFKVWYLVYFSGSSCIHPFLNILFRKYGMNERSIGLLALLRPLVGFPSGMLLSGVADAFRKHKVVLIACLLVSTVTRSMIWRYTEFYKILILVLISGAFSAPCTTITDSACTSLCTMSSSIGIEEEPYARQRMFGAIGWGTCSFLSGYVIDAFGFLGAFMLHGVFMLSCVAISTQIGFGPLEEKLRMPHRNREVNESYSSTLTFRERFMHLVSRNKAALVFFLMTTVMGTAVGTIENFLFLSIQDKHGSLILMGLSLTVTCVSETLVFYFSNSIIHWLGLWGATHLCFLAFFVRLTAYILIVSNESINVWVVLPVEVLHGLTFGLTWAVGTQKSEILSPKGLEATTQSIFQGLMFGLGYGIGGLVGGFVYSLKGATWTFAIELVILSLGWIISSVLERSYGVTPTALKLKHKNSDVNIDMGRLQMNDDTDAVN